MDTNKAEDPRSKSSKYLKGVVVRNDVEFDFIHTQFVIDNNYIGDPPDVQVSIVNLNDNIDENFLRKDFSAKLGRVKTVEIVRNPSTNEHLGLAKVQFEDVKEARLCVENYDGKVLMGRRLNVFKDSRFAKIEELKLDKLQPKPLPPQKHPTAVPSLAPIQAPVIQPANSNLQPHSHLTTLATVIPPHQILQKSSTLGLGPIPSPLSLDYPSTTPGSIGSSTTPTTNSTPDLASGRLYQRLDERLALLKKKPNCLLPNLVTPIVPQVSQTYNSLNLNETNYDYANSGYYQSQSNVALKVLDKQRLDSNNHRREENSHHNSLYQNKKELHHKYDTSSNRSERYPNDQERTTEVTQKTKQPAKIELNEKLIQDVVLPYCYPKFYKELEKNLLETIFKKLRETYGYQCLEKAQQAYRANLEEKKKKEDLEKLKIQLDRQLESKWLSSRTARPVEAPKPRVQILRERHSMLQDDRRRDHTDFRRVNRSSAYVADPERRGSHNTSVDSDLSDSDSSSSSSISSRTSSSSSSMTSRSSSASSSRSQSPSSCSSDESYSIQHSRSTGKKEKRQDSPSSVRNEIDVQNNTGERERLEFATVLLTLSGAPASGESIDPSAKPELPDSMNESEELLERPLKTAGKKRKKGADVFGVASEYRSAKRFASNSSDAHANFNEDIENSIKYDENYIDTKPESRFTYEPRSQEEKDRMLNDLYGTLTEEDVEFLKLVHERDGFRSKLENQDQDEITIPFGSDSANKAHLNPRKHMIEGKAMEGHPKWWRGCSRCDVIEISETEKIENEELNYEDLSKAPIKSHVIQAANSSRRDQRGDQRRIAALNANLDAEFIKMYTTNTLQMRAKNLRFSRSKIHKWGLFACEKISSGDAVIEYVGEKIRPSLADHREKIVYTNLPTHDGSSYFFRVDSDVIDATLKGNKARFINHSCNPNCIAKVIKHDNGTNSIVIYAKQVIQEDEEITYDYKFPREETDQKICCNCRAPNCQKFLN